MNLDFTQNVVDKKFATLNLKPLVRLLSADITESRGRDQKMDALGMKISSGSNVDAHTKITILVGFVLMIFR